MLNLTNYQMRGTKIPPKLKIKVQKKYNTNTTKSFTGVVIKVKKIIQMNVKG